MFKISLKPVIKDREFEIKVVQSGRKDYKCCICGAAIKNGEGSVSFTKRVSVGLKTTFETYRTCLGKNSKKPGHTHCTITKAKELNVDIINIL